MMMEPNKNSAGQLAEWVMRSALRLWPRESGDWGRALAAELPSTAGSWEAVRWTMGGLMVLMREWWRHAMGSWKRPIGVPSGGALEAEWKNAPRVPRTPRWVTAMLLVASACLLITPDVRQAMPKGLHAWHQDGFWSEDEAALARLRAETNRHRDPQLLAVLAIMSGDNKEKTRDATEAVQADPSLTWIYSKIRLNPEQCCMLVPPTESEVTALEKWDPDNAMPRFLAADKIFERAEKDWLNRRQRGIFDPWPMLARDPEWRAAMDFAFAAPKYDSYSRKAFDLYRSVSQRYGINQPELAAWFVIGVALPQPGIDSTVYFERGEEAERSGQFETAASLYWKPVLFAEQVLSQDHSNENGWGNYRLISTQREAFEKLEPLLLKMGRADEAKVVQYRLASAEAAIKDRNSGWWRFNRDGWSGLLIRSLAPIIPVLGIAVIVSMFMLFVQGREHSEPSGLRLGIVCTAIDLCPLLLLMALAGLFASYHPIALTYQHAISSPWSSHSFEDIFYAANAPYGIPLPLGEFSAMYLNAYHFWMAAIVGLSMLALYIIFRRALRGTTTI
jgi:hypothetical protein